MALRLGTRLGSYEIIAQSAPAAWARCIAPVTPGSAATSRSRCCPPMSRRTRNGSPGSSGRHGRVAALNHPNIVTLHSIEDEAGFRFLTMELVEGQGLDALLRHGELPIERVLEVGIALADALAAAHDKGIVHRDLTPANIMLTGDERVKILDFGLARTVRAGQDDVLATLSETQPGVILGTPADMSLEHVLEGLRKAGLAITEGGPAAVASDR